jgi:enamine deaminase RidA (YjgF/YER057c/UK114 family)
VGGPGAGARRRTRLIALMPADSKLRDPGSPPHGSRRGRLMFVGGQADLDAAGNIRNPGRLDAQTEAALDGVARTVESLGGRWQDVAKINVFHVGSTTEAEDGLLRAIRARFRETPPVISLVALPRLSHPDLAVLVDAVAVDDSDGNAPRRIAAGRRRTWPRGGEFSEGLRCGEFLLVSAQSATDPERGLRYRDDIVAQAELTIANIGAVLDELGADLDDVVKLNTWYVGFGTDADWRRAAKVRSEAFRFPGPGATGVPVPAAYPDGALLRQECWALRAADGSRLPRSLSWPLGHWDWPMRVSFQQGIRVGDLVFLGGQVALDASGRTLSADDMKAQTRICMDYVANVLAGFGAGLDDMLKLTCFYKTRGAASDFHETVTTRTAMFPGSGPPSTTVPLENLGFEGVMLEIEGIAAVGASAQSRPR